MLLPKRLQMRPRPLQFGLRFGPGIRPRCIAHGAFEFNFRATPRALVFEMHLIVTNHAFDQLVPGKHPLPRALQFGGLLGGYLWPASAGAH